MSLLGAAFWLLVLVAGVSVAHWGADKLAHPVKKLRQRWALGGTAGGAIVGLAVAMPEVSLTASSVVQGASDIGLGLMVGTNVISLPLLTTIAYVASRPNESPADGENDVSVGDPGRAQRTADADTESSRHALYIDSSAATVVVLPYVAVVSLVALLTLPAPWRGLQPVDGWIMLGAYAVFLTQSVVRGRADADPADPDWSRTEFGLALAGLVTIVVAASFIVRSTDHLAAALGVSDLVGGLFVTAPLGLAPEAFGTWSVVRSGQVTAGSIDVFTDAAATMTLGFFPLAVVGLPIHNFRLYWVSLAFAVGLPAVFAALLYWQRHGYGLERWQVLFYDGLYLLYLAVVVGWVLPH
ncbi:sodium:calcium antiporter [Haloarcula onubensis]|uniref:Sodium/calcium exchanger membrane region domain-containing protein n=1 Tax=Haloarcula onubensis TaxID=2950539 RepID=A0ABU2FTB3_9EURY|nr:hypothetical protein [Halomicroarcula sp. S3CR25-11]MDS0284011.1 hypothetical protein [Halomicroarcula sp. S3CR25-11]